MTENFFQGRVKHHAHSLDLILKKSRVPPDAIQTKFLHPSDTAHVIFLKNTIFAVRMKEIGLFPYIGFPFEHETEVGHYLRSVRFLCIRFRSRTRTVGEISWTQRSRNLYRHWFADPLVCYRKHCVAHSHSRYGLVVPYHLGQSYLSDFDNRSRKRVPTHRPRPENRKNLVEQIGFHTGTTEQT